MRRRHRATLVGLFLLGGWACGGGGVATNSGTGPGGAPTDPPAPGAHEFHMSYVVGPDTTRIVFHGYPVWCGTDKSCVRLSSGFPQVPGLAPQIHVTQNPGRAGPNFLDDGVIFIHPNITGVGTWRPAQCLGQCLTFNLFLGSQWIVPPGTVPLQPQLSLSAIPDSLVVTITTAASDRVTMSFTGTFARLVNGTRSDTVRVLDGYVDARTYP